MSRAFFLAALLAPGIALAAGTGSDFKPKSTKTTKTCTDGKVWDKQTKSCKDAQHSALDDDELYGAVREFAYAGQLVQAQTALAAMTDQNDDRVLTYWGFTHRKLGNIETGMQFYKKALDKNPGNILARSYMGQALLEQGDLVGAREQLLQIQSYTHYDSSETWAETSLRQAILTGQTYSY